MSPLLPGPATVAADLVALVLHGRLLADLGISLARVAASFVAVVLAVEAFAIRPLEQSLTRWRE